MQLIQILKHKITTDMLVVQIWLEQDANEKEKDITEGTTPASRESGPTKTMDG